jgi:hypothetical protein
VPDLIDPTRDEIETFIATARSAALEASRAARDLPADDPRREGMRAIASGLSQLRDGWKQMRAALYPPTDAVVLELRRAR